MAKKLTKAHLARIAELVEFFETEGLFELAVEDDGLYVELKSPRAAQPVMAGTAAVAAPVAAGVPVAEVGPQRGSHWQDVPAPMTGVFYRAPAPDQPPYVQEGGMISMGQTIGLVEAMKVFSEIPSPVAGRVIEIVAQNGALIAEGDVLMVVDPKG